MMRWLSWSLISLLWIDFNNEGIDFNNEGIDFDRKGDCLNIMILLIPDCEYEISPGNFTLV